MSIRICGDNTVASPAITSASDTDTGLQFGTNEVKVVNGNLDITDGNLKVASGHGIDFSATADSSGTMTSELLDDYEEGTWTPTINSGGASITPVGCIYRKIGSLVFITGRVRALTTPTSSDFTLANLPFSPLNPSSEFTGSTMMDTVNFTGTPVQVTTYMDEGLNEVRFYTTSDNVGWVTLKGNEVGVSGTVIFSIFYIAA